MSNRLVLLCGISKGNSRPCRRKLTTVGYRDGRIFSAEPFVGPLVGPVVEENGTSWWGGVCQKHRCSVFVRHVEVVAAFEAGQIGLEASKRVPIFRSA